MPTANEEMLDASVRHQIRLLRLSKTEAGRAARLLDEADRDLGVLPVPNSLDTPRFKPSSISPSVP